MMRLILLLDTLYVLYSVLCMIPMEDGGQRFLVIVHAVIRKIE
jgi:hypothetical protein